MNIYDAFTPQVDELQRQLGGAEDEKKTLNQVSDFSTLDSTNRNFKFSAYLDGNVPDG